MLTYIGWAFAIGGACIVVIAVCGCCGAVKEWRPLLVAYAFTLMLLLAFEIAMALYVSMNQTEVREIFGRHF